MFQLMSPATAVPCRVVLLLVGLFSTGCAMTESEREPVSFHVMSEAELSIDMQAMADRIAGIAIVSLDQSLSDVQRRDRVLSLLNSVEMIAKGVKSDGVVTNYSIINRYMGSFLYDVSNARELVNREPPNLVPAQRLIRSCLACHQSIDDEVSSWNPVID